MWPPVRVSVWSSALVLVLGPELVFVQWRRPVSRSEQELLSLRRRGSELEHLWEWGFVSGQVQTWLVHLARKSVLEARWECSWEQVWACHPG